MSLFDATVSQVVKDVSDKTLFPVPNRSSADYCKILWLVERKTRSWHLPWKSAYKFIPTEIALNDVLIESVDVKNLEKSSILLENYTSTPSYHRAGKIGGKIAQEFDVDVSVNETMEVSLKLGNVMKQEVLWQDLSDTVNGKKVKTDHKLVKAIKRSPKRSLFVIAMVVTSGTSVSSMDKEEGVAVNDSLNVTPQVALNLSSSGSSDSKQHRQYTIPLGTTLAYSCYKVKVDNGVLNLQLGNDLTDAMVVEREKVSEVESMKQVLSGLLTNKNSNKIIIMLRKILKNNPACAFRLNVVVENAIDNFEDDLGCKITVQHLDKIFSEDCSTGCYKFLEIVGFQINKENNEVVYPEDLDLLTSLNVLLDCLSEMNKAQIQTITDCDISHREDLMSTIQKVIELKEEKEYNVEFSEKFAVGHPVSRFLESIGFKFVKTDSSFHVEYLAKCQSVLHSSLVAVYGMCSV